MLNFNNKLDLDVPSQGTLSWGFILLHCAFMFRVCSYNLSVTKFKDFSKHFKKHKNIYLRSIQTVKAELFSSVTAILNFSKITCTLFLISIFEFLRPEKIMKFMHGGHFEFL